MEVCGINKIPNFWISSLSKGHEKLESLLSEIVESLDTPPNWLFKGITYLSLKTKEIKNPKNYRPITSLTTTYKLLTSILTLWKITMHSYWSRRGVKEALIGVKTTCS